MPGHCRNSIYQVINTRLVWRNSSNLTVIFPGKPFKLHGFEIAGVIEGMIKEQWRVVGYFLGETRHLGGYLEDGPPVCKLLRSPQGHLEGTGFGDLRSPWFLPTSHGMILQIVLKSHDVSRLGDSIRDDPGSSLHHLWNGNIFPIPTRSQRIARVRMFS